MQISFKEIMKFILIGLCLFLVALIVGFYIVNRQNENSVKEMANKVQTAAEYYVASQVLHLTFEPLEVNFPDNKSLQIGGTLPNNGYLKINSDTEIEMRFHYLGYCISKEAKGNLIISKKSKDKCLNEDFN